LGGERTPLEGRDELLTIAEIAIGIAGFSGVVVAFVQRGSLPQADRLRFLAVFATAFSALLLAFVPSVLSYSGVRDAVVWRLSSLIMVLWSVLGLAPYPRGVRMIRAELGTSTRLPIVLFGVPSAVSLGIQLLNAGGWIWKPSLVPYLFGMLVYLYVAGLFFVFLVLFRPST
jgi:hypothetical protein